jgi:multiple sugar transport system permease protein
MSTLTLKRVALKAGFAFSVFLLVSPAILVFLWMLSLSLKNEVDNTAWPPVFIPNPPTLANYIEVFARNNFLLYLWNSILVTGGAVLVGLVSGVALGADQEPLIWAQRGFYGLGAALQD